MAGQQRKMEGNDEQRRAAARDAREQGKSPSEVSATQGASKQRKEAPAGASHQERMDTKHEGKHAGPKASQGNEQPRPGNRERDPKREEPRE